MEHGLQTILAVVLYMLTMFQEHDACGNQQMVLCGYLEVIEKHLMVCSLHLMWESYDLWKYEGGAFGHLFLGLLQQPQNQYSTPKVPDSNAFPGGRHYISCWTDGSRNF